MGKTVSIYMNSTKTTMLKYQFKLMIQLLRPNLAQLNANYVQILINQRWTWSLHEQNGRCSINKINTTS